MMTTTGKEYILEDFIEAVTGMKLTNARPINPYQIETYQKTIENLNPVMYSTIEVIQKSRTFLSYFNLANLSSKLNR